MLLALLSKESAIVVPAAMMVGQSQVRAMFMDGLDALQAGKLPKAIAEA
jgi:hypothetical protein